MHDLSSTSPAPAAARNRRSGRMSGPKPPAARPASIHERAFAQEEAPARTRRRANKRAAASGAVGKATAAKQRKKAAKKRGAAPFFSLTWGQGCVLGLMLIGILAIALWGMKARTSLNELNAERQQALEKYQREVNAHQVKYRDWIQYYAALNSIDPAYAAAIIKRESNYDPRAVSRVGARGLMQIMPDTGTWLADKAGLADYREDSLFDPETSIRLGCWYLGFLSRSFGGDPILVACAYHAGQGNVRAWLEKYSSDGQRLTLAQIPMADTRNYAGKVMNAYAIYQQYYY